MPNNPWALPPKPGTYRIVNVGVKDHVIEAPLHNEEMAVSSPWSNKPHQQWIIQYSGRGYKIKNVHYKRYLALLGSNGKGGSVVGTRPEPITWMLIRTQQGFMIQHGDEDMVINLHYAMGGANNILNIWPSESSKEHRRWNFEYICDDVGGELADTIEDQVEILRAQLRKQAMQHDAEKLVWEQRLAEKDRELRAALQSQLEGQPRALSIITELRQKAEELERLSETELEPKRGGLNNVS